MEQGEVGCGDGWWMEMVQDLSNNGELSCPWFYFFRSYFQTGVYLVELLVHNIASKGIPVKYTMEIACNIFKP
jgi:hypothetical protein